MSEYNTLRELVEIDSPTGYTEKACAYVFKLLKSYGYHPEYTNKGAVRCALGKNPKLAIAAHIDTLGAVVSGIRKDGTLSFSKLGGPSLTSAEGEYVNVYTMQGKVLTGTLLLNNPSSHANDTRETEKRNYDTMHVRLDEEVSSKKDTEKLGIRTGDMICFEPRYREYKNGFIKSRFMDNKAGCYVLFEIARRLKEEGIEAPVELFFSNYEEVGHGGTAGYSAGIEELLVIDMGVLGDACEGNEQSCSICVKDSSGPYDYNFRVRLVELAEENKIPYKLDVYPFYSSDGSAALRAGKDFRVALIGPGVAASHGVERTHVKGIEATIDLSLCYIFQYLKSK
ncbi:MAG TPA: M42 family metallopeptidase [Bacteroidia bacterium]|jgi:putative aminopeptidase FrvX|nr:M42 family metallopeptidase [Bacteroidia bacterium]